MLSLIMLPTTSFYTNTPIVPTANCTLYPVPTSDMRGLQFGRAPFPLFSCAIVPSVQVGYYTSPAKTFDGGALLAFIAFYSPNAIILNVMFQVVATVCLLGAWDKAVSAFGRPRSRRKTVNSILLTLAVICKPFHIDTGSILSFVSVVLMGYVDTNLGLSQGAAPSYGLYGNADWYYNPSALNSSVVQNDVNHWTLLNGLRGWTGLFAFVFCTLARESHPSRPQMDSSASTATIIPM